MENIMRRRSGKSYEEALLLHKFIIFAIKSVNFVLIPEIMKHGSDSFGRLFFLLSLLSTFCLVSAQLSFGRPESFNEGWLFALEDNAGMSDPDYDDGKWRRLDVPHDWSIEGQLSPSLNSCTGYLPGGTAWYRKHFTVSDSLPLHYIYFEGVYNRSEVYLNGHLLGKRPNGYVSFYYDMTPYLREGENVVAVRVDHSREADSRWYTGSGIYRDVYIIGAGRIHFEPWGLGWHAVRLTDNKGVVAVDLIARDETGGAGNDLRGEVRIFDAGGKAVARKNVVIKAGIPSTLNLEIPKPKRWSPDSPYLYTLKARLFSGGEPVDSAETRVGLRTLEFSPDKGFAINGKNMKVKGVCLHHDAGTLGAVVPREVWRRRLMNLKGIGANAIRMSHNPQAPVVYDLCDELGLLVMDEGSDEWEFPKRKWVEGWNRGTPKYEGTYDFFEEWIERDITDMVLRDRNHPSVFLWSVGNEVDYPNDPYSHPILDGSSINQPMYGGYNPEAPDAERIGKIAKRIAGYIRRVDTSRPVTGALAGVVMSNHTEYPEAVDVVGYNYTENRYDEDHKTYPARIIYGSENGQDYGAWKSVRDKDFIFGQFIWTGTDYLGESGAWPSRGLHTGLLDFGSFPKPRGKFRASLWCEEPVAFLGTYRKPRRGNHLSIDAPGIWNYEEGDSVRVVCYTNASSARLLLNGEPAGDKKGFDDEAGMIFWDMPFKSGTLKVEALNVGDEVIATDSLRTSGRPYALKVTSDVDSLGNDCGVAHLTVEVVDEDGIPVVLADNNVVCRIHGPLQLLGLEGSDNTDMGDYRDNRQRVYGGRLLAYVKKMKEGKGKAKVVFSSPLLKPAEIELTVE